MDTILTDEDERVIIVKKPAAKFVDPVLFCKLNV